ncbi:MAG TPA: Txe/YoeB family addiction module toxin [Rudaea sp.]
MARRLAFDPVAWEHYVYWQGLDRKIHERINVLIRECRRDPFRGIGKPEPLKGELSGWWSRRIDDTHRLVYRVKDGDLEIISCRYHYGAR